MRTALGFAVGLTLSFVSPLALAQDPPAGGAAAGGGGEATVTPPKPAVAATAPKVEAKGDEKNDAPTDHEKFVGHFAVGYLGLTNLPLGGGATAQNVQKATVASPVIGMRYWLNKMIGIDAGLGIALASSSLQVEQNNTTTTTDGPAIFGGALHGGVPIALATGKHYTFQVVPELNVGFTSRTDKFAGNNPPPDLHHSGFRLDVGARVGTEVHFGFIGVPELALQASVGLFVTRQVWHNSQDTGTGVPAPLSSSIGETGLGTTVQSDPWALFVNNVSALYYF